MTDDYLWDRSGAPDDFVAALERGLQPLGAEAEALLDEQALLDELEAEMDARVEGTPMAGADEIAEVVPLPTARPKPTTEVAQSSHWIWMSAAAALLLAVSAMVLLGEARARSGRTPVQVGGGAEPSLRVEIGVEGPQAAAVLTELRPSYAALARCGHARMLSEADTGVSASFQVAVTGGEARVEAIEVRRGELDDASRGCVSRILEDWRPSAVGDGTMNVVIVIE